MIKKRNAQGLSINVIILAVLGILVLFALVYMFTQESGKTAETLGNCLVRGGNCIDEDDICTDGTVLSEVKCKNVDEKCCVTI